MSACNAWTADREHRPAGRPSVLAAADPGRAGAGCRPGPGHRGVPGVRRGSHRGVQPGRLRRAGADEHPRGRNLESVLRLAHWPAVWRRSSIDSPLRGPAPPHRYHLGRPDRDAVRRLEPQRRRLTRPRHRGGRLHFFGRSWSTVSCESGSDWSRTNRSGRICSPSPGSSRPGSSPRSSTGPTRRHRRGPTPRRAGARTRQGRHHRGLRPARPPANQRTSAHLVLPPLPGQARSRCPADPLPAGLPTENGVAPCARLAA